MAPPPLPASVELTSPSMRSMTAVAQTLPWGIDRIDVRDHGGGSLEGVDLARRQPGGESPQGVAVGVIRAVPVAGLECLHGAGDAVIEVPPGGRVGLRPVVGVEQSAEALKAFLFEEYDDHRER